MTEMRMRGKETEDERVVIEGVGKDLVEEKGVIMTWK